MNATDFDDNRCITRSIHRSTTAACLLLIPSAAIALPITQVHQSMDLYVYLEDQFAGGAGEEEDAFSAAFDNPVDVLLGESVGVMVSSAFNTAAGALETEFGPNAISGNASLTGTFGSFPSFVGGWSLNRIVVSFLIEVQRPTEFAYQYSIGAGFGTFSNDDIYLYGDDGSVFFQYGFTGIPEAEGAGLFLPGVKYEFFASLDSDSFGYLDNIDDPLVSWATALSFGITVIPAPGIAPLIACGAAFACARARR